MANCPNLESCPFFYEFEWNTDTLIQGWIRMYCNDIEKSDRCERKKYKLENGTPAPAHMSPTGKLIGNG